MIRPLIYIFSVSLIFSLKSCGKPNGTSTAEEFVDFGNLKQTAATKLMSVESYVALESSEKSLLGHIGQMEVSEDHIYILDDKMNTFNVFGIDGKFVMKLEGSGNGPGEFISPHSFWIDKRGYVLILDRQLNRLLKYRLDNLDFAGNVTLPAPSPLSFAVIPDQEAYIYYYPSRQKDVFGGKQFIMADSDGTVIRTLYDAPPTGKILHGYSANFYLLNGHVRTYPHFSNRIYELKDNSLNNCYEFSWGKLGFPPVELFQKYDNSGEAMREILTGDNEWIRLIYVYETARTLAVKYYIKRDLYLSVWDKKEQKTVNVKSDMIVDGLGLGSCFPLPVATFNDLFVGIINPFDVTKGKIKDKCLMDLLDNTSKENNPILVFYSLNPIH